MLYKAVYLATFFEEANQTMGFDTSKNCVQDFKII